MKVFISWSGEKSRQVANAVQSWLTFVHQGVETWVSTKDIHVGDRWANEIESGLTDAAYGIICVTPDNVNSKWINFEAGAISKKIGTTSSKVAVLLIDFDSEADLEMPLSQFHAVMMTRAGFDDLATSINAAIEGNVRTAEAVLKATELAWSSLEHELNSTKVAEPDPKKRRRTDKELLEEILIRVREMDARLEKLSLRPGSRDLGRGEPIKQFESLGRSQQLALKNDLMPQLRKILQAGGHLSWSSSFSDGELTLILDKPTSKLTARSVNEAAERILGPQSRVTYRTDPEELARLDASYEIWSQSRHQDDVPAT